MAERRKHWGWIGLTILVCSFSSFKSGAFLSTSAFWQNNWLLLLAGQVGGPGSSDGPAATATFQFPAGLVFDAGGNLYVADQFNCLIRKITTGGTVSTFAGNHTCDYIEGPRATAAFSGPTGLVFDAAGNMYVADAGNSAIRKITTGGTVSTLAGGNTGYTNATGAAAAFDNPSGIAIDGSGSLYIADTNNNVIRRIIISSGVVSTFAGNGSAGYTNGSATTATFNKPAGLVFDSSGNLFVADSYNSMIRKVTSGGAVTNFAGAVGGGALDGSGTSAQFTYPWNVARDSTNNLYVTDQNNQKIRKVTPAQAVTTIAGNPASGSTDATGTSATFDFPFGIALDASANIFVSDNYGHIIRKIDSGGVVTTFAGAGRFGAITGTGVAAKLNQINRLGVDSSGNVFTYQSGAYYLSKITPGGVVTNFAGSGASGSGNGTGVGASFGGALGVTVFAPSTIYVADTDNHTVRRVTSGAVVTTYAGAAGVPGSNNAMGNSAHFTSPAGVATDSSGVVYVADTGNNMIRKISTGRVVTTLAGNTTPGYVDAGSTSAAFNDPRGIAVDTVGNVYVADAGNNVIRKITVGGMVSTLAGSGAPGADDGVGTAASFSYPIDVAVDSSGNVYVADYYNFAIRKITPAGSVTTVVGQTSSFHTVAGTQLPGSLSLPVGVAIFKNMLFISVGNGVVWTKRP